ncbi:hypothetical protein, partial [Stenotrophomonas maltophilia]|uniref:hypothetical protein n=1 Tax=Stenotrophomonas maltophilia TaxID=40324 RepID=UPI0013DADC52
LRHPRPEADLIVDLRGNIDAVNLPPVDGAADDPTVRQLEILGWALANNRSTKDIELLIDGRPMAGTNEFFSRADVEAAFGVTSPAGWRIT